MAQTKFRDLLEAKGNKGREDTPFDNYNSTSSFEAAVEAYLYIYMYIYTHNHNIMWDFNKTPYCNVIRISSGAVSRKVSLGEISGNAALVSLLRERTRGHVMYTCMYNTSVTQCSTREYEKIVQGELESRDSRMRKERLRRYFRLSNHNVISPR